MNQKGFTLLELLVGMVIGGMVMVAALSVIFHIFYTNIRNSDQVTALHELSYATELIKVDIRMAQYTNLTDGDPTPQSSLEVWWIDQSGFTSANESTHHSIYTLSGSELLRTHDGTVMTIGRQITYLGFILNDDTVTCNIAVSSSSVTERSEDLVFDVMLRRTDYE